MRHLSSRNRVPVADDKIPVTYRTFGQSYEVRERLDVADAASPADKALPRTRLIPESMTTLATPPTEYEGIHDFDEGTCASNSSTESQVQAGESAEGFPDREPLTTGSQSSYGEPALEARKKWTGSDRTTGRIGENRWGIWRRTLHKQQPPWDAIDIVLLVVGMLCECICLALCVKSQYDWYLRNGCYWRCG